MTLLHLRLLAVVLFSLCVFVHAGEVEIKGFTANYGMTGCLSPPTEGCGRSGTDICYNYRVDYYAITGTSPVCNACMPKDFRSIASFAYPINLPCAIWRYYGCDDAFVTFIWNQSGNNGCYLGGHKSYNIKNFFSSAAEAENRFVTACREQKTLADYGLPENTPLINEKDFCFPLSNNITDIIVYSETGPQTVLSPYKEYYEKKFNVTVPTEA